MLLALLLFYKRVVPEHLRVVVMRKDAFTISKRGNPRPQIECYADEPWICRDYCPKEISCKNVAPQGQKSPLWSCAPKNWSTRHSISSSQVICEGWDSETDQNTVEGSCMIKIKVEFDRVRVQIAKSPLRIAIPLFLGAVGFFSVLTVAMWIIDRQPDTKEKET